MAASVALHVERMCFTTPIFRTIHTNLFPITQVLIRHCIFVCAITVDELCDRLSRISAAYLPSEIGTIAFRTFPPGIYKHINTSTLTVPCSERQLHALSRRNEGDLSFTSFCIPVSLNIFLPLAHHGSQVIPARSRGLGLLHREFAVRYIFD